MNVHEIMIHSTSTLPQFFLVIFWFAAPAKKTRPRPRPEKPKGYARCSQAKTGLTRPCGQPKCFGSGHSPMWGVNLTPGAFIGSHLHYTYILVVSDSGRTCTSLHNNETTGIEKAEPALKQIAVSGFANSFNLCLESNKGQGKVLHLLLVLKPIAHLRPSCRKSSCPVSIFAWKPWINCGNSRNPPAQEKLGKMGNRFDNHYRVWIRYWNYL